MKNNKLRSIATILFLLIFINLNAQCINGDCDFGFGEKKYPDKSSFVGNFEKGNKKDGTYYYANGDTYKGAFIKNQRAGEAIYTYKNGEVFSGSYVEDKKTFGTFSYKNGDSYTGDFENNLPHGYGTMTYKDGKKWEGDWIKGKKAWGSEIPIFADTLAISPVVIDSSLTPTIAIDSVKTKMDGNKYLKSIAPRIFAVVVGISDYQGTAYDLKYSDDDASIFYSHLKKALPNEMANGYSVLLLNQNATRNNVFNALQQVFSQSTENDFIIFYFSGHGSPNNFCPYDMYNQNLEHDIVRNYFKNSKAKYRLCIADACFSGSIGSNAQNTSVSGATQNLKDSRIAVIMSSKPNQTSMELGNIQQGLFSYYLINGLRGNADLNNDSYITMGELFFYTKNNVTAQSGGSQIPVVYGQNLDKIPLTKIKR
jgi:hypothetical protein